MSEVKSLRENLVFLRHGHLPLRPMCQTIKSTERFREERGKERDLPTVVQIIIGDIYQGSQIFASGIYSAEGNSVSKWKFKHSTKGCKLCPLILKKKFNSCQSLKILVRHQEQTTSSYKHKSGNGNHFQ